MIALLLILFSAAQLPPEPIHAPRPTVRWIRDNERRHWRNYQ